MSVTTQPRVAADTVLPVQTKLRIGYVVSRFPKLTETFILNEVLALLDHGDELTVYPLNLERQSARQPGVERALDRMKFVNYLSLESLRAVGYYLRRKPRQLLSTLATVVRETAGSPKFLVRSLALLPKSLAYARHAEANGVEHLHAHFATHATTAAYIMWRLTDIPYSFTAHAHDIYVDRHMLGVKADAAQAIVTISDANRLFLAGLFSSQVADRIVVVRNGIDLERFVPPTRAANTDRLFRVLCVGALEEKKGQRFLIEACGLLQQRGVPIVCDLLGSGPDQPILAAQFETLPKPRNVRLLGGQPRDVVINMLQAADVVVLPSIVTASGKTEGLPVALTEAMACGRAVVATRVAGVPELVIDGETGLLVAPRSATELADALEGLFKDPHRRASLGAAGRAKVSAEYDRDITIAQLRGLFARAGSRSEIDDA